MSRSSTAPFVGSADLARLDALVVAVETVFRGKTETVRLALASLLARGHILFEDVPGTGKTTLARALAAALGLEFRRIQFTSDLLPSDLLGVTLYNPRSQEWETRPGPIFAQVVLADEINRAPPRTQSGLLEAMQEGQVTLDQRSWPLPQPFLVIATQNPQEQHGTYPLPESQLDRFLMRLSIGLPAAREEREILLESMGADPFERLEPVFGPEELRNLQGLVDRVHVEPELVDYLLATVHATRTDPRLRGGVSTRGALALFRGARAYALVDGRTYLVPDDVRRLAVPCLAHRLLPAGTLASTPQAHAAAAAILDEVLAAVAAPL